MLLDDQEVTLPFRGLGGDVPPDDQADPGLAAQGDLADRVLEGRRVDGDAEARRQDLAVELWRGRPVDPAVDPGGPSRPVLVGREVSSETREGDRVAERASPLSAKPTRLVSPALRAFTGTSSVRPSAEPSTVSSDTFVSLTVIVKRYRSSAPLDPA